MNVSKQVRPVSAKVMRRSGHGQGENGIISGLDMSGEMHMWKRSEVFGCIPHGRGAFPNRYLPAGEAGLLGINVIRLIVKGG